MRKSLEWLDLASVATVTTGGTPPKSDPDHFGGSIPWVKPSDLSGERPITTSFEMLSEKGAARSRIVPKGSVLVCCIGSVGRVGIAGVPLATNQQINAVSFGGRVTPRYGYHCLAYVGQTLGERAVTSLVAIINKSDFSKIRIPVPPLEEQRRIMGLLDRAAEIRRRADAARAKARAIIPALFVDMFGDPATLTERYGGASFDDLIESKLLGLVRSTREQPENGAVGYVRMNAITNDGRVVLEDLRRTDVTPKEATSHELLPGDLLFNTRNSYELVGKMGLYAGPPGNVFNNNIMRVRFEDRVLAAFVNAYFQTTAGQASITSIKKGTTSVCAIYYKDLERSRIERNRYGIPVRGEV